MRRSAVSALSLSIAVALVSPIVFAQSRTASDAREAFAPDTPDSPACAEAHTLDVIQVTATKRPESSLEVAAATTIVTRAELGEAAMQTPMDALHGEVGTFVQQTTPGQGVVIVRGLKGSEVLHLVDGFRLNNAIFRNSPNQYIALVDGQSLDRIEVVRGPSSTLYGGDAMGGVVQMLTPALRYSDAGWDWSGGLRAIAASADDSLIGRAEVAGGGERVAFSLGATSQEVNDLRVGGGDVRPQSGLTARSGDFKVGVKPAEGHEFVLSVQYAEQPRTPRHDALVPGFGQTNPENAVFFFEPQQRRFAQLLWRIDAANALFDSGELRVGRQTIVDDRRTRAFGTLNEEVERNRDATTGFVGQFGKQIGEYHHLSYGVEVYRDTVNSSRTRTNINTGATSVRAPRFPDGSWMKSLALYVADDWRVGRFDLNAGLRYSRFDVKIPESVDVPGVRLDPDDLTGNIGVSIELTEPLRFVANLGRGFRAPNIFDLGIFGVRPGNRYSEPNPNLTPESVISFDAGFKYGGERMSGELIAFRSSYQDKITSVLTGEVRDGALVVQNRNITRQDLWGVEAGARYRLPEPDVELYATATYTRGDERSEGLEFPADRIPPLYGKLGARWKANDRLGLEAYAFYASAQDRLSPRDAVDPRINPNGTGGWATLNLRADWRIFDGLGIAVRAENLADKRYREHGSGLDEPGRNVIVSLDYRF